MTEQEIFEKLKEALDYNYMYDSWERGEEQKEVDNLEDYLIIIKQERALEKDFNDVAYATVRSFVMKFEKLGLLLSIRYGSRTKYKVKLFIFFICVYILSFII